MAAVFDLDADLDPKLDAETARAQAMLDQAMADAAFGQALDQARGLGGRAAIRRLREYSTRIAAVESELLAEHVRGDGNTRDAEKLLADGKTSKREQRKKANRAKAVGNNRDLASKMASGELSEEQVDVIAGAAAKTDGDAANDADLINKIADVPPEQGQAIADDYVAARATADGVQSEHDRQRSLRRASKYHSKKNGLHNINLEGDRTSTDTMWDHIERLADALYKADGGRDLPTRKHPRTSDQRLFDAAYQLICGTANQTETAGATDTTGAAAKPTASARPRIVIGMTVDHLLGTDPEAIATQIGLGHIPQSVLADYAAHADILAALYDRNGEPLWLGRLRRHASTTQRVALIIRDRGCVLCGASHTRCEAHHAMPHEAPGKGRTDLDNLVLLCTSCHTALHANHQTIYLDTTGTTRTWRTRPATPDELPPDPPAKTRNRVKRE